MLDELSTDLWVAEGQCVNFHGFAYPTRMVVARLSNGDIWVWSPIKFTDELAQAVADLGAVKHLISPNKIHHLFLTEWQAHFPEAALWGPQSSINKRRDLDFHRHLDGETPSVWQEDFEQFHVQGSLAMDEIVFFHKASRSLILADFSENFSEDFLEENWSVWRRRLAKLWGITDEKGYAPLDWRLSFFRRKKLRQLRDALLSCDVEKVVMAHGEIQHSDGNEYLKRSLSWIK